MQWHHFNKVVSEIIDAMDPICSEFHSRIYTLLASLHNASYKYKDIRADMDSDIFNLHEELLYMLSNKNANTDTVYTGALLLLLMVAAEDKAEWMSFGMVLRELVDLPSQISLQARFGICEQFVEIINSKNVLEELKTHICIAHSILVGSLFAEACERAVLAIQSEVAESCSFPGFLKLLLGSWYKGEGTVLGDPDELDLSLKQLRQLLTAGSKKNWIP